MPSTPNNVPAWTHHFANKAVSENVKITHSTVKLLGLKQRVNNDWTDGFKLGQSSERRKGVLERTNRQKIILHWKWEVMCLRIF